MCRISVFSLQDVITFSHLTEHIADIDVTAIRILSKREAWTQEPGQSGSEVSVFNIPFL